MIYDNVCGVVCDCQVDVQSVEVFAVVICVVVLVLPHLTFV